MELCILLLLILTLSNISANLLQGCTNREDGRYPLGECEKRYIECWNGIPYFTDCQKNFIYNKWSKKCEKRNDSLLCEGSEDYLEGVTNDVDGKDKENESEDSSYAENSSFKSSIVNVCENLEDGTYSTGSCDSNYFACTSNIAHFLSCWPLHYDPIHKECSGRTVIDTCANERNGTITRIFDKEDYYQVSKGLSSICKSRKEGLYPVETCSDYFLACHGMDARVSKCPDDSVFDPEQLVCNSPINVTACLEKQKRNVVCEKDGMFSAGRCSSMFTICKNGSAIHMTCPTGLKFSEKIQTCEISRNIQECPKTSSGLEDEEIEADYMEFLVSTISEYEYAEDEKTKRCFPNFVLHNLFSRHKNGFDLKLESIDPNCLRKVMQLTLRKMDRERQELREYRAIAFIFGICFVLIGLNVILN